MKIIKVAQEDQIDLGKMSTIDALIWMVDHSWYEFMIFNSLNNLRQDYDLSPYEKEIEEAINVTGKTNFKKLKKVLQKIKNELV